MNIYIYIHFFLSSPPLMQCHCAPQMLERTSSAKSPGRLAQPKSNELAVPNHGWSAQPHSKVAVPNLG